MRRDTSGEKNGGGERFRPCPEAGKVAHLGSIFATKHWRRDLLPLPRPVVYGLGSFSGVMRLGAGYVGGGRGEILAVGHGGFAYVLYATGHVMGAVSSHCYKFASKSLRSSPKFAIWEASKIGLLF